MGTDRTWTLYEHPQFGWRVNEVFGDLDLAKSARKNDWPVIEVVEESRLREAEAERDLMERANETSMKLADDLAGDVERLEAELREAGEALRAFVAISPGPLDTQTGIVGRPPEEQVDEYRQRATKVADDLRIALDRARGVLEKGDKG